MALGRFAASAAAGVVSAGFSPHSTAGGLVTVAVGNGGCGGVGSGSLFKQRCVGVTTAIWPKLNALVGDVPSGGVVCAPRFGHLAGGGEWLRFLCLGERRGGAPRRAGDGVRSRYRLLLTVYCGSSRRARCRFRRRSSGGTVRFTISGET